MNAILETSLPQVLADSPVCHQHRRHQIGHFRLSSLGVDRFNDLLRGLGRPQALDSDQIATAARQLLDAAGSVATPACILQRLEQADALSRMFADRAWEPANDALAPGEAVLKYLHDAEDLIPDWMPQVGRLDDAIVIDTAWPQLSAEVLRYLDFCRLRQIEIAMGGDTDVRNRFGRAQWETARRAEAQLRSHGRRVWETSYLPAPSRLFRIH